MSKSLAEMAIQLNVKKLTRSKALNPDAIHDKRVAARRLRAALKTFKKVLPRSKKMQAELKKLGSALGKKRDLDLFSQFIRPVTFPKLALQMEMAQEELLALLKSKSYESLIESLQQLKPVKQNRARKEIQKALKRVSAMAPAIHSKAADKTLHNLRIAVKKLRYVCEFFEPLFSQSICSLDDFLEKTRQIQDTLGAHQDAITGIALLRSYQFSSGNFLQLKKKYELKKRKTRQTFFKIWPTYCLRIRLP